MASGDQERSQEQLKKLFAWWEKEMASPKSKGDVPGEKPPSDRELVKMAYGEPEKFRGKTARAYLKAQAKQGPAPVRQSEYQFFKKKVRLNVVEKKVHRFQLDQDEINSKRSKRVTI